MPAAPLPPRSAKNRSGCSVRRGPAELAVAGDDLERADLVGVDAVGAGHRADAAAGGVADDADVGGGAADAGQAVRGDVRDELATTSPRRRPGPTAPAGGR